MTTHRAPEPHAHRSRPVERAMTSTLAVAVLAGFAWLGGMIYTLTRWSL
ncbi:morphogenic membrane protein MmpA [Streptomyces sp. NPDC052023]